MSTSKFDVHPADANEPLLQENKQRFVLFPIKHPRVWEMYKKAEASFGLRRRLTCGERTVATSCGLCPTHLHAAHMAHTPPTRQFFGRRAAALRAGTSNSGRSLRDLPMSGAPMLSSTPSRRHWPSPARSTI